MLTLLTQYPRRTALLVAACSLTALLASASWSEKAAEPPRAERPPSITRGRHNFVQSCAHCHGDDAHGSGEDADGPDLYQLPLSHARITAIVSHGIPGEMPSFSKKYGPDDVNDLVAYLRTLR